MTYLIAWEFQVRPERRQDFERIYGADGEWAQLFRRGDGYLGTELLRDREHAGRYLVLDRWTSPERFGAFKSTHADDYQQLDHRCEALTQRESPLGTFITLESLQ